MGVLSVQNLECVGATTRLADDGPGLEVELVGTIVGGFVPHILDFNLSLVFNHISLSIPPNLYLSLFKEITFIPSTHVSSSMSVQGLA